jgi:hypothetical protein
MKRIWKIPMTHRSIALRDRRRSGRAPYVRLDAYVEPHDLEAIQSAASELSVSQSDVVRAILTEAVASGQVIGPMAKVTLADHVKLDPPPGEQSPQSVA